MVDSAPNRPPFIGIAIVGGVIAVAVVVVLVMMSGRSDSDDSGSDVRHGDTASAPRRDDGTVEIEIHARPAGSISMNGHPAGHTPLTLHVQQSDTAVTIEAVLRGRHFTKLVTPDHDQRIDFPK